MFEHKFQSPIVIHKFAMKEVDIFNEVIQDRKKQLAVTFEQVLTDENISWVPALDPYYKINFDVAYVTYEGSIGFEVIIRNQCGDAEVILAVPKPIVPSMLQVESYALLCAMQLCQELVISHVIFDGDAKVLIDNICSKVDCSRVSSTRYPDNYFGE